MFVCFDFSIDRYPGFIETVQAGRRAGEQARDLFCLVLGWERENGRIAMTKFRWEGVCVCVWVCVCIKVLQKRASKQGGKKVRLMIWNEMRVEGTWRAV